MRWKALAEIYKMNSFAPFGLESQKPRKSWGEKNLVHITPGKNGQEKLRSSRSSLLNTTSAREMKRAYEYETKY